MEKRQEKQKEGTQQELITIALAVYNPNRIWLKELLDSLNRQTYSNLELIVCDDASEKEVGFDLMELLKQCITVFPFRLFQNRQNRGSNQTFLGLISEAAGKYIAFCDQDDIWMKDKIAKLYDTLKGKKAVLSYCDMQVIDQNGKVRKKSLKRKRSRLTYIEGENLTGQYMFRNCTAGCSMLFQKSCAFLADCVPEGTYWDHWLCILASMQGRIVFVPEVLVGYRIHGKNQSGILAGIRNWEEYYQERVLGFYRRVGILHRKGCHYLFQREIECMAYARKERRIKEMWKYRFLCPREVYFEIVFGRIPSGLFQIIVWILRFT